MDVVINNAGISIRHDFMSITPEEWRKVLGVDLDGVFYVAQQAAQPMLLGSGGVILNTASTNALVGYRYYADYNATKAGLVRALTKSLALEWAPKIRVNAVCPGYVLDTDAGGRVHAGDEGGLNARFPLGRHATPGSSRRSSPTSPPTRRPTSRASVIVDGGEIAGGLASR